MTLLGQELLDLFYPIGSGYLTKSSSYNPNIAFNNNSCSSTWVLSSKGRAIVGVDTGDSAFNTAGKTGGSKEHNHTLNNGYAKWTEDGAGTIYTCFANRFSWQSNGHFYAGGTTLYGTTNHTYAVLLGGTTDNTSNLQPYECWYIWERTA